MRPDDPQLVIELHHDIAEVGGAFTGTVRRSPLDGSTNQATLGKVRAIRVVLRMKTDGRGDEDSMTCGTTEVTVDEHGMATAPFELTVPSDAPISYDGELIRVRWEIEARTDRQLALDSKLAADVLVVPRGGLGLYNRPHPLPPR